MAVTGTYRGANGVYVRYTSSMPTIRTTGGNTTITALSGKVTMNSGNGNDIVNSSGSNVSINGGSGNDKITHNGSNATILGGAGKDTVEVTGSVISIFGGAGDDSISIGAGNYSSVSINGGSGNDIIYGNKNNSYGVTYIFGSNDGSDTIYNFRTGKDMLKITGTSTTVTSGSDLIVKTAKGSIRLVGANSNPTPTPDFNVIKNTTASKTIYGTSGKDSITNSGAKSKIYAGYGDDYVFVYDGASNTTIWGDAGKDTIEVWAAKNSIIGGAGDDSIKVRGNKASGVTVNGGTGNDVMYASSLGTVFDYANGDGNDVIYDFTDKSSLRITGGAATTVTSGNDTIVRVGSGSITLKNYKKSTPTPTPTPDVNVINNTTASRTLYGTSGKDSITNSGTEVVIYGGAGNDTIKNNLGNKSKIYAGDGDDSIYIFDNYTTVDAGAGDDTISGASGYSSLLGGAGNDIITLSGGNVYKASLIGGTGNDTLVNRTNYNVVYGYNSGDGNDSIVGAKSGDTLVITGNSYTKTTSGSDLIFGVGSSSITVVGGANISLSIKGTVKPNPTPTPTPITNYTKNAYVYGTSSAETIKNYAGGAKVYAGAGDDSIYSSTDRNYTVNSSYGYVTIDGGNGKDTIYSYDPYVSISGGAGDDSIVHYGASYRGVTINAGTGNDIIRSNDTVGVVYQFASVDGSDVIYGFTSKDTIQTHYSMRYSWDSSTADTKVTIGNAQITLKNFKGKPNVIGGLSVRSGSSGSAVSDLFADDNFIGESTLDEISAVTPDRYSVGKVSEPSLVDIAPTDNLSIAAYSSDK